MLISVAMEMFLAMEKWKKENRLPIPVIKNICKVTEAGIGGIKRSMLSLANRTAVGKIVLDWE